MKLHIILTMVLALFINACAKDNKETIVWKLGHVYSEDNILHTVSLKFAEEVEKNPQGALKIQVYPNSLEGNEVDNITWASAITLWLPSFF